MAGETHESVLNALTTSQLGAPNSGVPARRNERPTAEEPIDPGESREIQARGRTPAEVLGDRDEVDEPTQPAVRRDEDDDERPAKSVKVIKYRGQELTPEDFLKNPEVLDAMAKTAEQLPILQQKYQKLLEQNAETQQQLTRPAEPSKQALTPQEQAEQRSQQITQVLKAYEPLAEQEIELYVKNGLIEEDLRDAYPKGMKAMFAILLYHIDQISVQGGDIHGLKEWIAAEMQFRNAGKTKSILDTAIDKVAARADDPKNKNARFYKGLKKAEAREAFVQWLRKTINPQVSAVNEDLINQLWLAFAAEHLLDFNAGMDEEVTQPSRRRRAAGDPSTARAGGIQPEPQPKGVLDHLIDSTGRFPAEI